MMHIIMSCNYHVLPGVEACIYSTMKHNKNIHWHIFTMDVDIWDAANNVGHHYMGLDSSDEQWLRYIVKFMDFGSELTLYNVKDVYMDLLDKSVNRCTKFTPYTALRLIADIILPDVDHSWYFDADLIVQDDVSDIYNQICKNKDYNFASYVARDARDWEGEMVAGILIMNLDKARRTGWLKRARYNYNNYLYKYPDQLALENAADFLWLDETYGYLRDHRAAPFRPKILHCTHVNKKVYDSDMGVARFYRYYPEHAYIKEGLDMIKEVYQLDKHKHLN